MALSNETCRQYTAILHEELVPALGCTEPIAVAYAAARAARELGGPAQEVSICVSGNIIKNVKSVVVPNTGGLRGLEAAAAAGIVAGEADRELEVISNVTPEQRRRIADYLKQARFAVSRSGSGLIFDIDITLKGAGHSARCRIAGHHTHVVLLERDGHPLINQPPAEEHPDAYTTDRSLLNVADIVTFADETPLDGLRELLDRQVSYNMAIAQAGLDQSFGARIGQILLDAYGDTVSNRAKALAAAASDARMNGCGLPVVINSGSGNQGITVSIPVIEYAKELGAPQETLYRALALSNLIAIHEKTGIGRLSAYCGAVSAGCAAGCGIAYLQGADCNAISHTLVNALAIVSGIICDGAKPSCAAKIASSVEAGILGYHMYLNGQQFRSGDGIITKGVEATIRNVGRLGREGMRETDKEIVKIMMD